MGRRQLILVSAICASFILTSQVAFAQGQRKGQRQGGHAGHGGQGGAGNGGNGVRQHSQFRNGGSQERFYRLSPDDQRALQRNAERWLKMNPEQQKMLREREQVRRQQMKMEAEAAMQQSGLRLDGSVRDQWEARYLQERRRIERELRQEYEAKKQQELPQLNERLKSEFQSNTQGNAPGNPNPTSSAKKKDK